MGLPKRIYGIPDLDEHDLWAAPSLDLSDVVTEKYYTPKDHGKYMLFLVNVKKSALPRECPFCGSKSDLILSGRTEPRQIHDVMRNNYRVDIVFQPVRLQYKSPHGGEEQR